MPAQTLQYKHSMQKGRFVEVENYRGGRLKKKLFSRMRIHSQTHGQQHGACNCDDMTYENEKQDFKKQESQ